LVVAVLCLSGVAAAQSDAKEPNAVPAAKITPQPAQAEEAPEMPAMPSLRVGLPAPPLKVVKWFKGTPVERLEPGKIYVVEFWATWCGPCKVSIPHLTELAHEYADKVTFIGVSVWERPAEKTNEAIAALVEPFVEQMGEKMDYHVAADGIDRTMANTWMTASEQNGIPCAFIVGKDSKIAWIGHPSTMDDVLAQVVAGTFDVQAEAQRQENERRLAQERAKLEAPIRAALSANDNQAVVEAVDKALAVQPEMESGLMAVKFRVLLQMDESKAFAYLKTLLDNGGVDENPHYAINAALLISRASDLKDPNYALLVTALEKAKPTEQENPNILVLYAEMLFKVGQVDKAIEMQQQAIEKGKPYIGTRLPQEWADTQKATLEAYQAKSN
jgi:thiol-disulfide isomerase/thioredoxin